MKILKRLLLAAAMALPLPLQAESIDLTSMKCSQLAQAKESSSVITAWLAGYYTDADQSEVIDLTRLRDVGDKLGRFCAANPNFTIAGAALGLFGK
jgi:hypothetical protein